MPGTVPGIVYFWVVVRLFHRLGIRCGNGTSGGLARLEWSWNGSVNSASKDLIDL